MGWGMGGAVVAVLLIQAHTILAQQKCGLVPSKVYLAKGEKRQLVFWTDQDYSQAVTVTSPPTTTEGTTSTTTEAVVDSFLQAVNGQLPGFGSNKDDAPFQFGNEDNATEYNATVVNAELPELAINIDYNSTDEDFFDDSNSTFSTDSVAPVTTILANEIIEGVAEITTTDFSSIVEDEITTGTESVTTEVEVSTLLEDVEFTDEPVTAANVFEIEDVWMEVPKEEISVDKWPSPVIAEVELTTLDSLNTTDTESVTTEIEVSTILEDVEYTDEPVTAANVIEIEDIEDVWMEVPKEDISVDKWPSPVIAEEDLTTWNSLSTSSEITTDTPLTVAPNVAEIEDGAWVDLPGGIIEDEWANYVPLKVASVVAEEEYTTVNFVNKDTETTTNVPSSSAESNDTVDGEESTTITESEELSEIEKKETPNVKIVENIDTILQIYQNVTEFEDNDEQEAGSEALEKVGLEATDSAIETTVQENEETTTITAPEDLNKTEEKETLTVKIIENIDQILQVYQNVTDYEDNDEQVEGSGNINVSELSIPLLETTNVQSVSEEVLPTTEYDLVNPTVNTIQITENTILPENKITFADEVVATVEPVSLVELPEFEAESSGDDTSADTKIVFLEDEDMDLTTENIKSGEINDDDIDNDTTEIYEEDDFDTQESSITERNFEAHYEDKNVTENLLIENDYEEANETIIVKKGTTNVYEGDQLNDTDRDSTEINYDVDDEDKIQVVTSMSLKDSEDRLQDANTDSDNVIVVTSATIEEPIRSWDELELFDEIDHSENKNLTIDEEENFYDEFAKIIGSETITEKTTEQTTSSLFKDLESKDTEQTTSSSFKDLDSTDTEQTTSYLFKDHDTTDTDQTTSSLFKDLDTTDTEQTTSSLFKDLESTDDEQTTSSLFKDLDSTDTQQTTSSLFKDYDTTDTDQTTSSLFKDLDSTDTEQTTFSSFKDVDTTDTEQTTFSLFKDVETTDTAQTTSSLFKDLDSEDTEQTTFSDELTDEPTFETLSISTQDNISPQVQGDSNEETSILFGLDIPKKVFIPEDTASTTYYPIIENEIQDDDTEYSYYDQNFDVKDTEFSPLQEDENKQVFTFTTTGSPVPIIEAVVAETESSDEIFDETTTGSSIEPIDNENTETLFVPIIQAVVAENESSEENETTEEIFDETTTGSSIAPIDNEKTETLPSKDEFAIEAIESETELDNIFDETTTGKPLLIPSVEAVIAEFDETTIGGFEVEAIFADTTTGSPEENSKNSFLESDNNVDVYIQEVTTDGIIISTNPTTLRAETPAFTTASSKINTTSISIDSEDTDSSKIIFPKDDEDTSAFTVNIGKQKEDAVTTTDMEELTENFEVEDEAQEIGSETGSNKKEATNQDVQEQRINIENVEVTTVRVVVDSDSVEATSRKIISASDFKKINDLNAASEEQITTSTESAATSRKPVKVGSKQSEIVQVEAGNVNGPLSLDEVVYYDDADGNEEDFENDLSTIRNPVKANIENKLVVESSGETGNSETTTEGGLTTVINGFIINKKQIVKTLDNNNIETVRTSGDKESVNIDISKENNTDSTLELEGNTTNEEVTDPTPITTEVAEDNFKTISEKTTNAPIFEAKDIVTDQTEQTEYLSTKNPNVVIDVVDNVLELEDDETDYDNNNSTEPKILDTPTEVQINKTKPDKEKKPATFPVTELLNGIYRLIQGYIPTRAEIDPSVETLQSDPKIIDYSKYPDNLEYFDSPNEKPLSNVHNSPRGTTPFTTPKQQTEIEDSVDFANSNTDPFQQLSAPDLTGLIPEKEREDNVQYIFAAQVKKSPPITLSPFNSDALRVEEPPKVLYDEVKEKIDIEEEEDESSFTTLTKAIQQPFKVFLPSFLTSPKIKSKPEKIQVAGSLPVTVRDPVNGQKMQVVRRPIQKPLIRGKKEPTKSRFPLLGSLFSSLSTNSPKKPALRLRRPMRPDVPAQQPIQTGFVPIPARQRSSPVSIPLPGTVGIDQNSESQFNPKLGRLGREEPIFEASESIDRKLLRFIEERPLPMRNAFLKPRSVEQDLDRQRREAEEPVNCTWTIQTEKNLYLLVTFHNLSAPFTVDCEGAYIEVERENNGFEARWCGNRVTQGGSRPHVIFARNEVRITVFDDGLEGKNLPTGFNADVEVIDLFDAGEFSSLRKTNGYSSVRTLAGRSLIK